jgi:heme exporter protein B
MTPLLALVTKDLLTELRLRQVLPTMAALALVMVTVFGLVTEPALSHSPAMTAALLWLAFTFAALLAVERAFASEKESRAMAALLAAPLPRQTIFLAKCVSSLVLLLIVQIFTVPLAMIFFESTLGGPALALAAVLLLGDAALVIIGTLTSAMVVSARVRGPLLSVLALPLLIPVVVMAAGCAAELANSGWTDTAARLVMVLGLFDVVFLAAGWLLAPHVLEP